MKFSLDQYVPNLTAMRPLCLLAGAAIRPTVGEFPQKWSAGSHTLVRTACTQCYRLSSLRSPSYSALAVFISDHGCQFLEVKCRGEMKIIEKWEIGRGELGGNRAHTPVVKRQEAHDGTDSDPGQVQLFSVGNLPNSQQNRKSLLIRVENSPPMQNSYLYQCTAERRDVYWFVHPRWP